MGSCCARHQFNHWRGHLRPSVESVRSGWDIQSVGVRGLSCCNFLVILCFSEVGSRFTATGGSYLYARMTFGALVGFQVGWLMWLGRIAAFASLSNLFVGYFAYFVPAAGANVGRAIVIDGCLGTRDHEYHRRASHGNS